MRRLARRGWSGRPFVTSGRCKSLVNLDHATSRNRNQLARVASGRNTNVKTNCIVSDPANLAPPGIGHTNAPTRVMATPNRLSVLGLRSSTQSAGWPRQHH